MKPSTGKVDMPHNSRLRSWAPTCAIVLFVALAAACAEGPPTEPDSTALVTQTALSPDASGRQLKSGSGNATVQRQLARLRRVTARYHRRAVATRDGYTILVRHPDTGAGCIQHPELGGMGFHLLKGALADGTVEVTAPEVLIYRPMPDGQLHLVAVEYIIPFAVLPPDAEPPTLLGNDFVPLHTFGVWGLHAWVWQNNPAGVFANFNPKVSCEDADKVEPFSDA